MKNKRLALKLLAKDCQIGKLYVKGDKTCAVGCLALASGATKAELKRWNSKTIYMRELCEVRHKIEVRFGLSEMDLGRIQKANDDCEVVADRRKAVIKVVMAIKAQACPNPSGL